MALSAASRSIKADPARLMGSHCSFSDISRPTRRPWSYRTDGVRHDRPGQGVIYGLLAAVALVDGAVGVAERCHCGSFGGLAHRTVPGWPQRQPVFGYVFVVVMENLDYQQALATPGLVSLA